MTMMRGSSQQQALATAALFLMLSPPPACAEPLARRLADDPARANISVCATAPTIARVLMPVLPRGGSTFLRMLLDFATNVTTETCCWAEGGTWSAATCGYGSREAIRADNGERGASAAARTYAAPLRRAEEAAAPPRVVFVKSHHPGWSFNRPPPARGSAPPPPPWPWPWRPQDRLAVNHCPAAGALVLARAPDAMYEAWRRSHFAHLRRASFREFLFVWCAHAAYWIDAVARGAAPASNDASASPLALARAWRGGGGAHALPCREGLAPPVWGRLEDLLQVCWEVPGNGHAEEGVLSCIKQTASASVRHLRPLYLNHAGLSHLSRRCASTSPQ